MGTPRIFCPFSQRCVCESSFKDNAALTCTALEAAITERVPSAGCIHHSDRGVQYAAEDYIVV